MCSASHYFTKLGKCTYKLCTNDVSINYMLSVSVTQLHVKCKDDYDEAHVL